MSFMIFKNFILLFLVMRKPKKSLLLISFKDVNIKTDLN